MIELVRAPGANLSELRRLIAASLPFLEDAPGIADWLGEDGIRWSSRRKVMLLVAIARGEVDLAEVMRVHALTAEELLAWARAQAKGGIRALQTTRLQELGEVRT